MTAKRGKDFTISLEGKDVVLYFKRPNQSDLFEMDLQYRVIYSKALRAGVATEAEARKRFAETGAWTTKDDDNLKRLTGNIAELEIVLKMCDPKNMESIELASRIAKMRAELLGGVEDKNSMLSNTAEGLSREQRMHKLIEVCCVESRSSENFFEGEHSYKSFVAKNPDEMSTIYREGMLFEYSIPEDLANDWGEVQFMKKFAALSEEEQDAIGQTEKVKVAKKKVKKKTTRKKNKNRKKKTIKKKTVTKSKG